MGSIFEHVYNTSRNIYENLTKIPKSNITMVPYRSIWVPYGFHMVPYGSGNVCPSCTKPCFSINVRPSCTKPLFSEKCVPLLQVMKGEPCSTRCQGSVVEQGSPFMTTKRPQTSWSSFRVSEREHIGAMLCIIEIGVKLAITHKYACIYSYTTRVYRHFT